LDYTLLNIETKLLSFLVMPFGGKNINSGFRHFVNQPVLFIDTSRPLAGKIILQRLRFPCTGKGVSEISRINELILFKIA